MKILVMAKNSNGLRWLKTIKSTNDKMIIKMI